MAERIAASPHLKQAPHAPALYGSGVCDGFGTKPLSPLARMKYRQAPSETLVMIDHQGKVYQGSYHIGRNTMTVSYGRRQMVTSLGKMPPVTMARMILREMVAGKPREAIAPPRLLPRNYE